MSETACVHGHTKRVVGCVSCVLVFDNLGKRVTQHETEGQRGRNAEASTVATGERPVLPATSPPTLRHLAEAATPGPWQTDEEMVETEGGKCVVFAPANPRDRADAEYIAAMSPDVTVALLDERDAHAQQIATLRAELETISAERDEASNRADLAQAYMAGMRAACGQPLEPLPEPYRKGRLNFEYQEGLRLAHDLLDVFARRTDRAQDRADAAEARATTVERERDEAKAYASALSETVRGLQAGIAPYQAEAKRLREDRDRLQRELDAAIARTTELTNRYGQFLQLRDIPAGGDFTFVPPSGTHFEYAQLDPDSRHMELRIVPGVSPTSPEPDK